MLKSIEKTQNPYTYNYSYTMNLPIFCFKQHLMERWEVVQLQRLITGSSHYSGTTCTLTRYFITVRD